MPKIFISYRREDATWPAQQIRNDLATHFGSESVVFDVDNIPLGVDYRKYLSEQVEECDVLVAVIGIHWLGVLKQRLEQDAPDWVRIEIQAALARDIPVVPVLIDDARIPDETDLPEDVSPLAYRHATKVESGPHQQDNIRKLIAGLERHFQAAEKTDHVEPHEERATQTGTEGEPDGKATEDQERLAPEAVTPRAVGRILAETERNAEAKSYSPLPSEEAPAVKARGRIAALWRNHLAKTIGAVVVLSVTIFYFYFYISQVEVPTYDSMLRARSASVVVDGREFDVSVGAVPIEFLDDFRRQVLVGRGFVEEEYALNSPVVMLSSEFWMVELDGDTAILGASILIDNTPQTVVGVLASGFTNLQLLVPE